MPRRRGGGGPLFPFARLAAHGLLSGAAGFAQLHLTGTREPGTVAVGVATASATGALCALTCERVSGHLEERRRRAELRRQDEIQRERARLEALIDRLLEQAVQQGGAAGGRSLAGAGEAAGTGRPSTSVTSLLERLRLQLTVDSMGYHELYDRFGGHAPTPPAPEVAIKAVPCRRAREGDGECPICLDAADAPAVGGAGSPRLVKVLTRCGHTFHQDCLDTWLREQNNCPVCRCQAAP